MKFFRPEGQKIEKFGIFRGNFSNPNQKRPTRPKSKNFDPNPSLPYPSHSNGKSFCCQQ